MYAWCGIKIKEEPSHQKRLPTNLNPNSLSPFKPLQFLEDDESLIELWQLLG